MAKETEKMEHCCAGCSGCNGLSEEEKGKRKQEESAAEGRDVSLLKRLLDDDNDDNITLFDNDGKEIEVEQVATVNHENEVYAVLHIVGDPEEEVLVFKIDQKDEESIAMVEDEKLANTILKIVMDEAKEEEGK